MSKELKKEISDILQRALAGYLDDFKYRSPDGKVFIRWGLVEKMIHESVDRHTNKIVEPTIENSAIKNKNKYFDYIKKTDKIL